MSRIDRWLGETPEDLVILSGLARGARMRLSRADDTKKWLGVYERKVQGELRRFVHRGLVAWDVGAHRGFFSLGFVRADCEVVSVEPHPETAGELRRNLGMNTSRAEVIEAAVSDSSGLATLYTAADDHESSLGWGPQDSERESIQVPSITLDEIAAEYGSPALIKMDIEGEEANALQGAEAILAGASRPVFVVETHSDELASRCCSHLVRAGYSVAMNGKWIVAQSGREGRPARLRRHNPALARNKT